MPDGSPVTPFLPYGRQTIEADDIAAVAEALQADFLTTGPLVDRFEDALAARVGAKHAVVCSNGTAALHLAIKALKIGPGDLCVVPSVTFLATANCARYEGAEVVFADVDPDTGLMTPATLVEALERCDAERVRAILPVHLCGAPADTATLARLARSIGAVLIEDACHALATDTGRGPIGACADSAMACFSFHPVKTLTTGEGGAVTTNDPELAARLKLARSHGMTRDPDDFELPDLAFDDGAANPWWYEQQELGLNYRLPDFNCALGLSQLAKLDRFVARRRRLAELYREALASLGNLVRPVPVPPGSNPTLHLFAVLIDFEAAGLSRRAVMQALKARGIGTQVHYIPVHRQPYYTDLYGETDLPGADAWYRRTLSLPLYPAMSDEDPARVVHALAQVLS